VYNKRDVRTGKIVEIIRTQRKPGGWTRTEQLSFGDTKLRVSMSTSGVAELMIDHPDGAKVNIKSLLEEKRPFMPLVNYLDSL